MPVGGVKVLQLLKLNMLKVVTKHGIVEVDELPQVGVYNEVLTHVTGSSQLYLNHVEFSLLSCLARVDVKVYFIDVDNDEFRQTVA